MRSRMEWVHRNRRRRIRTESVGVAVQDMVQKLEHDKLEPLRIVADVLGAVADDDFRQNCLIGGLIGRTLVIHVNELTLVSVMRSRWKLRFERALRVKAGVAVSEVQFSFGRDGLTVPMDHEPSVG